MNKSQDKILVNRTKLYRPSVAADYISRDILYSDLEDSVKLPLTIVSAPAGYGKSSLISHWLDTRDSTNAPSSAWLSLDASDSDVRNFLTYFVAALRTVSADACKEIFRIVNAESIPPLSFITTQLSNDLDELDERLILVLDDYYRINDTDIDFIVNSLLEHPSRNLHLIILSRQDPGLSLAPLRAYKQLNEIRMRDLKFSSEDTLAFIAQTIDFPLQANNIQRLQERTEGWPVGIRLFTLTLTHQDNIEEYLNHFSIDARPLQEFLVVEVLSGLSGPVKDCLLNISILHRFNSQLCEAVCKNKDEGKDSLASGEDFIEILENSGLFCVALDGQGEWFRFHHLFAELLHKQLEERRGSEEISRLHQKASHWFGENGYVKEAISHALAGGDVEAAVEILGSARHQLMNRDHWHRLEQYLNLFTHETVQQHVHLVLLRCWLHYYHWYQLDYMMKDLNRADVLLEGTSLDASAVAPLKAEVAAIRSNLAYWMLEPAHGVTLANQVLRDSPDSHECVRSTAVFGLGALHQMLGEVQLGEQIAWDHMNDGRFSCPSSRARLILPMCIAYWPEGDSQKLLKAASRLLQIGLEHKLPWSESFARYFFGLTHYERNELNEAVIQLKIIVDDPYHYPIVNVTHCSFLLSLSYQALALPDLAREVADSIAKLTFERGNKMFIALTEAFQADLDLLQGGIAHAEYWVNGFVRPAPHGLQRFFNAELTSIRVMMALDTSESRAAAGEQLDYLHQLVSKIHHKRLMIDVLGMKALLANTEGHVDTAVALLHEAVVLGQSGQLIRPLADLGEGLVKLFNLLDLNQEGLQYVGKILRALNGSSDTSTAQSENGNMPLALSQRELEILDLFARNLSNKEIARQLFISPGTVKRHAHNIFRKLSVSDRHDAVFKSRGLGILPSN